MVTIDHMQQKFKSFFHRTSIRTVSRQPKRKVVCKNGFQTCFQFTVKQYNLNRYCNDKDKSIWRYINIINNALSGLTRHTSICHVRFLLIHCSIPENKLYTKLTSVIFVLDDLVVYTNLQPPYDLFAYAIEEIP